MAEVCTVRQNDKRHRHVDYDQFEIGSATIPRPIGTGDKRHIPMGNRTKCTDRNDKNGKRTGTQCLIRTVHFIPTAFYPRQECTTQPGRLLRSKRDNETAADVWTKILYVDRNREIEPITATERIASKFLSLLGKSTDDYELTVKNKPNYTQKQDDWTAIILEHLTCPNNMNIPQEEIKA